MKNELPSNGLSRFERMIVREYQEDAGIVGEESNIGSTFHILVTKDFRRELRLHEAIISLSGAGKSTLAEGCIKPFREYRKEDVIDVVRITGPALERYDNFDGKILLLSQSVGTEPTSIRPLLSEGKLGLMITEQKDGSNKFDVKIVEKVGMPALITTSTNPNIDSEFLRRVVQRTVDESAEQTRRIKEKQASSASTVQLPKLTRFRFIKSMLERLTKENPKNIDQVIIPYAREIEANLPDDVDIRSKLPQFLNLIRSVAIVKAVCYRGYFELKAPKSPIFRIVLSTLEDFNDALFFAGASFFHLIPATAQAIIDFLSSRTIVVKEQGLHEILERQEYEKCTIRQIQEKLRINASTIAKYANKLADQGLILKDKTTKGDTKVELNLYQYIPNTIIDTGPKLGNFDLKKWFKESISDKGFHLTYLKIESPLELDVFGEHVGRVFEFTSDSRVKVVHAQIRDTYAAQSTTVGGQTSRIRGASDSLVNSGQAPTITHESDISRIQSKQTQISTKGSTANLLYPSCTLCGKPAGQGNESVRVFHRKKYCEACYLEESNASVEKKQENY